MIPLQWHAGIRFTAASAPRVQKNDNSGRSRQRLPNRPNLNMTHDERAAFCNASRSHTMLQALYSASFCASAAS
jgi:hypothetical protein